MQEYLESDSVDELADLVELIYALLDYIGIGINDFEDIRKKKVVERGGFNRRLLLREVIEEWRYKSWAIHLRCLLVYMSRYSIK